MTFRERIYELTRAIPPGRVATYGQLAKLAGRPKAARAVGSFLKNNPDPAKTPCHRVVSSNGGLSGYRFGRGTVTKKRLLLKEGVKFVGERVDLKSSRQ